MMPALFRNRPHACHPARRGGAGRRTPRPGFTLFELSVVIAISAMVMVGFIGLFQTLVRADRGVRRAVSEDQTLARLSGQFRRDVRASRSAILFEHIDGSQKLELEVGDRLTTYAFGSSLTREVGPAREPAAEGPAATQRESYHALRLAGVRFRMDSPEAGSLIRMHLDRTPLRPEGPAESLEIQAALGRDLLLLAARKAETP